MAEEDTIDTKKVEVLPVYVVIDTSGSMDEADSTGVRRIDAANQIIPALVEVCEKKPPVNDKLRLSLIKFNNKAEVVIPLGKKDSFVPIPQLTAGGTTSFSEVFKLLRSEIEEGVRTLNTAGLAVFRPAVFFITDGDATDGESERKAAFAALTDEGFKASPHIVMFGVGAAKPEDLKPYVHRQGKAVIARDGVEAAEALSAFVVPLVTSIVASVTGGTDDATRGFSFDPSIVDQDLLTVFD